VFRGVVRACHDYRAPRVAAGITVLRAADGRVTEFEGHPCSATPDWGWAALTTGAVTTAPVPGTHHALLVDPQVAAVADAIAGHTAST
jgi:thioesterase domain-containing protein